METKEAENVMNVTLNVPRLRNPPTLASCGEAARRAGSGEASVRFTVSVTDITVMLFYTVFVHRGCRMLPMLQAVVATAGRVEAAVQWGLLLRGQRWLAR